MPRQQQTGYRPENRAIAGLTIGALTISFSGVWVRISDVTPTSSAFYRVLIGGICLLIGALLRKEFGRLSRRQTGLTLLCSAFFALDLIWYHYSIHSIGPGLGTILPNFQVFVMALIGVLFFREKLRATYLWAVPMAVVGLFLVVGVQWERLAAQYRLGIYAGLAASLCYTGFLLCLRKLQADKRKFSFFYVLMIVSLTTAGLLAAELIRTGDTFAIPDLQSLLALSALGICSQAVGWVLIANALPHLRVSLAGLILLLQPALAFVWDVLLFDRPTNGRSWIGVALVLGAIYMGSISVRNTEASDRRNS